MALEQIDQKRVVNLIAEKRFEEALNLVASNDDYSKYETFRILTNAYYKLRNILLLKLTPPKKGMLKEIGMSYFSFMEVKDCVSGWTLQEILDTMDSINVTERKLKRGLLPKEVALLNLLTSFI